jgi:hypothetical protein
MLRKILYGLLIIIAIALIVIQFFQPEKNQAPVNENEIVYHVKIPPLVKKKLVASCYDCHSNNTRYPWYGRIAPVSWLLDDHIRVGKENLNFSEWGAYSKRKQIGLLDEICEVTADRSMPLKGYVKMHKEAIIQEHDIRDICDWAETAVEEVLSK